MENELRSNVYPPKHYDITLNVTPDVTLRLTATTHPTSHLAAHVPSAASRVRLPRAWGPSPSNCGAHHRHQHPPPQQPCQNCRQPRTPHFVCNTLGGAAPRSAPHVLQHHTCFRTWHRLRPSFLVVCPNTMRPLHLPLARLSVVCRLPAPAVKGSRKRPTEATSGTQLPAK